MAAAGCAELPQQPLLQPDPQGELQTLVPTLKCQRVRTAMTIAVVVLPRPLEQLNTKAACESSARTFFIASSSRSKSCREQSRGGGLWV